MDPRNPYQPYTEPTNTGEPVRQAQFPPPPVPSPPYQPLDTSFGYGTPPQIPPPRRRLRGLMGVVALLLILAVGGSVYAWSALRPADPTELFETSLSNALSTKSYTQKDVDTLDGSMELKVDATDVRNLTFTGSLDYKTLDLAMSGYRSPQGSLFRLDDASDASLRPILNKWIQAPAEGTGADGSLILLEVFKPQYVMLGQYIIGSFAESDRQDLLNIIRSEQIYSYDPQQSVIATIDGQEVRSYKVKVSGSGLRTLNEKVVQITGLDDKDESVISAIELAEQDVEAVMHIATGSERLVKVETKVDGRVVSASYSEYDTTDVGAEPKADLEWDAYMKLLGVDNRNQEIAVKANDSQRQTDINALASYAEAFYAENGYYPRLAEFNDAAWRQANMAGLDPEALKDPNAAAQQLANAPAPNIYAYQVGVSKDLANCSPEACQYFKLTATLSDGSLYSKDAL